MPRQRAKERACEKAIKKTLSYRAVFKSSLSFYQLSNYLISKRKFDYKFFKKTLRKLVKNKSVRKRKGKYYLSGVRPISWDAHYEEALKAYKHNHFAIKLLGKIPWIKMIGVTGSLGTYNHDEKHDIDIFVVTENDRLWITRLFLVLFLKIIGKYPHKGQDSGKVCPNIIVDEKNMAWPKKKHNLYIANEIICLQPIVNKDNTYFDFLRKNDWVFAYFCNLKIQFPGLKEKKHRQSPLIHKLEEKLMELQKKHMIGKITKEIVEKGFVHFNVNDSNPNVMKEYKQRIGKLGIK